SPVSILGAGTAGGAAGAAGASAAGVCCANTVAAWMAVSEAPAAASASPRSLCVIILLSPVALQCVGAGLAGADAHRLLDGGDEDLPVADLAGGRRLLERLDHLLDDAV